MFLFTKCVWLVFSVGEFDVEFKDYDWLSTIFSFR